MRKVLLFCLAVLAQAQTPKDILDRARAKLAAVAAAAPKYICTQTVDRSYFVQKRLAGRSCDAIVANRKKQNSTLVLDATDRLRFDVEVADGGYEIYAWPDAARIANERIEKMAGGGPLGTGPFGPFLIDIFTNSGVQFTYVGLKAGRPEYRYRVPREASHYRVQAGVTWRTTGYDGTFTLDPASADLKQLTVRTLELPEDTTACEATTEMDFAPLKIGAGEYLLPKQTRLEVIGRDARVTDDSTVYAACHEFRGESALRFDEPSTESSPSAQTHANVALPRLPGGLRLVLLLDSEIDTDHAAAGDPVSAHLGKAVIDPKSPRVLVPAGSVARGRITHLEHHIDGRKYFLVGLSFEALETPGGTVPVSIIIDSAQQKQDDRPLGDRGQLVTTESHSGVQGGGTLVFSTHEPRYIVPRGYPSNWISLDE